MSSRRKNKNNDLISKKKSEENLDENERIRDNRKENHSPFADILNRKWRVFRVSPLYNFSFNKVKIYEEKLNKEINSKKKLTSNIGYKSIFTAVRLKIDNHSFEALQVKIIKDETQTSYLGHFISWNRTIPDNEVSVSLPILLVEAKTNEIHVIHSAFCKIFDCDIQSVTFSLFPLISFFVKLLETSRSSIDISQEQVILEYGLLECAANDKIKISLLMEATTVVFAVVMDNLRENSAEITTMDIIWEFYNKVLNHIYHVFNLDLMLAELKRVVFPDAFLTSDGQLKVLTEDAAISALNVLKHFTPLDAVTSM